MSKILLCIVLGIVLAAISTVSVRAQAVPGIYEPENGHVGLEVGYQYQQFNLLGQKFHNHGYNADLTLHVVDWVTGESVRLAVSGEGTAAVGFGHTGRVPNLVANSVFIGAGPRVTLQSGSRFEPWIHVLPGWQFFRFTQTATLGAKSAFGFMAGGGLDIKLRPEIAWRLQGDYVGTHFRSSLQNNYSIGSGFVFRF